MSKRPKRRPRTPDSYIAKDPERRAAQLGNLRPLPPVGPGRPAIHGGYAKVAADRIDSRVDEYFTAVAADAPLRDRDGGLPAADSPAVREAAETMCLLERVRANLRDFGIFDQRTGETRPAVALEDRLAARLGRQLDALGMRPEARVRLGWDLVRGAGAAFDLAQHWQDEDGNDAG